MSSKFTMRLDFRVLEHLGIRLYSNVSAVISELVANGWDAEAKTVTIAFNQATDSLVIQDDGIGMNVAEINGRFLTVGYDKRGTEGGESANSGRKFMGRKGIGKLSIFSVADVVKVYSTKDGQSSAFELRLEDLEKDIKSKGEYNPPEIVFPPDIPKKGTTLVMSKLQVKRTAITVNALRKRLARRFSIIGFTGANGDKFDVSVNGSLIGASDRDDLRSLEYLWEIGASEIAQKSTPNLADRYVLKKDVAGANPLWKVRGWFGTAKTPAQLEGEETGSLKNIIVLARGRLIQESILDKLAFNRIFGSYVTGQIQADFLDVDGEEDIATSDRQRLVEDDPRVVALRNFMREALLEASDKWSEVRKHKKAEEAEQAHPALKDWVEGLPKEQRVPARSLIGLIEGLPLDEEREQDRTELFRSGVLAFERLRLKEAAHRLENLSALSADHLLPLLVNQEYYEASLYGDIVKSRVEAIKKFRDLATSHAKEQVLQEHLFKNLWLLDAGWERASGSDTMETQLRTLYPKEFGKNLTETESRGRVDIKYRSNAGVHIIVELKKYERVMTLTELEQQGKKYVAAMTKLAKNSGETQPKIQVVFVLGRSVPIEEGMPINIVEQSLALWGARIAFYDALIEGALAAYSDYLVAYEKVDKVGAVVKALSS